jgi:hypothetical protein
MQYVARAGTHTDIVVVYFTARHPTLGVVGFCSAYRVAVCCHQQSLGEPGREAMNMMFKGSSARRWSSLRTAGLVVAICAVVAVMGASVAAAGKTTPVCPAGSTYNTQTQKCETPPTRCPQGTTFNGESKVCYAAPSCTPPGFYDSGQTCIAFYDADGNCPAGYSDGGAICSASATCPDGSSSNPNTSRCEATPTPPTCPLYFKLNTRRNVCQGNPVGGTKPPTPTTTRSRSTDAGPAHI